MLPDRVSNPGPLTYESGALPIALRGPACDTCIVKYLRPKNTHTYAHTHTPMRGSIYNFTLQAYSSYFMRSKRKMHSQVQRILLHVCGYCFGKLQCVADISRNFENDYC